VRPISVVLIDMAPMLREIVREAVFADGEIDLVREYADATDLAVAVKRDEPDVVILGAEAAADEHVVAALRASPGLRILGLAADGRRLQLDQLAWRRLEFEQVSPRRILDLIHDSATDGDRIVEQHGG
jgi:chemotaxis response regulator CheB